MRRTCVFSDKYAGLSGPCGGKIAFERYRSGELLIYGKKQYACEDHVARLVGLKLQGVATTKWARIRPDLDVKEKQHEAKAEQA